MERGRPAPIEVEDLPECQYTFSALHSVSSWGQGKRSFQAHVDIRLFGSLSVETPLQREGCSGARIVTTFHYATVHEEELSEKTATLDNVNDLGRCP
jgi:hypothetical protein